MRDKDKHEDALRDMPWHIPAVKVQLADGSTLIRPQKAIQRAQAPAVAKAFGLSTKTLFRLAEAGYITSARVTKSCTFYYPGEIEEFFQKMQREPDHWTPKRCREFGLARAENRRKESGK